MILLAALCMTWDAVADAAPLYEPYGSWRGRIRYVQGPFRTRTRIRWGNGITPIGGQVLGQGIAMFGQVMTNPNFLNFLSGVIPSTKGSEEEAEGKGEVVSQLSGEIDDRISKIITKNDALLSDLNAARELFNTKYKKEIDADLKDSLVKLDPLKFEVTHSTESSVAAAGAGPGGAAGITALANALKSSKEAAIRKFEIVAASLAKIDNSPQTKPIRDAGSELDAAMKRLGTSRAPTDTTPGDLTTLKPAIKAAATELEALLQTVKAGGEQYVAAASRVSSGDPSLPLIVPPLNTALEACKKLLQTVQ
jgi:hypothetical protein